MWQRVTPGTSVAADLDARGGEPREQPGVVAAAQRGVRLARGSEVVLDAEVELHVAALEPAPAAAGLLRRLRDLDEAEQLGIEAARDGLAAPGNRELDVVDRGERRRRHGGPA